VHYDLLESTTIQDGTAINATEACGSCWRQKMKCGEGRPECQHCKQYKLRYDYGENLPPQEEKQVLAITRNVPVSHGVWGVGQSHMHRDCQIRAIQIAITLVVSVLLLSTIKFLNGINYISASGPTNPQGTNMDAIPGLAYFA
jgi:hypothetical protein